MICFLSTVAAHACFYHNTKVSITMKYLFYLFIFCKALDLQAQFVYFEANAPGTGNSFLWQLDPNTCTICPVLDLLGSLETLILPNGDVLEMLNGVMRRYDPPSNNVVATIPGVYTGGLVHPNGTIYINSVGSLYTFDPGNNTLTLVGNFPANYAVYELFYFNGQLYGMADFFTGSNNIIVVLQIDTANPAASTPAQNPPGNYFWATSSPSGTVYVEDSFTPVAINTYNVASNTVTPLCTGLPISGSIRGLTVAPAGTPELSCICLSAAGTPQISAANGCVPLPLSVGFNNDAAPDNNDVVRYILYSDPNNPLGSIIQNNATPDFLFTPPLQADITYYVAQVVGNNLNGNFDPQDPCLDISPAVTVIWRPKPTVQSFIGSGDLCAGACQNYTITINGTPPFAYSWQFQQSGNAIGPTLAVFNVTVNPSIFVACVPGTAGTGPTQLVICGLTDAYCGNPNGS